MIKLAFAIIVLMGLVGCSKDSSTPMSTPKGTTTRKIVQVKNNFFSPKDLTVAVGDTVVWFNAGSGGHTSTSGTSCTSDGLWNSGSLSSGDSFEVVFDPNHVNVTGTIHYFCIPHCTVGMVGTVTVNP